MSAWACLKALDRDQRAAFVASLLGWTLDAFDFFLMVFILVPIAGEFHTSVPAVAKGLMLTLMFRPLGALVFGWLADRYGRKPVLMADIVLFSILELATAFAPSLTAFLVLRALFGIAMGGEWGIGASLVMESVPPASRGVVSGVLQEGYALGYLLAAAVFGIFYNVIGWRGMFVIGILPAALAFYIFKGVKESPTWERGRHRAPRMAETLRSLAGQWKLLLYVIVLMTAFNFFSHGTQDLYPTFLEAQRRLSTHQVSLVSIAANVGAIVGGVTFGVWSQRVGRRRAIVTSVALALPVIPLWVLAPGPVTLGAGAFLMQVFVQGAWGVIPAHLTELSPEGVRGTFPGFAYQLGNFFAAGNAVWQAKIAAAHGGNYALALGSVAAVVGVVLIIVTLCGREARHAVFGT